jgi:hypothetical protein
MSLDSSLERMKEEALEMGRYYYKGFGNNFNGILVNAELYLMTEDRQDLVENSYKLIGEIETHYDGIPFGELQGREDFYPLFVIRRLLPKFRTTMDEVFQEKIKGALRNLGIDARSIVNVGRLYGDSFQKLLEKIRSHPESSDFRVRIVDYQNNVWSF